MVFNKNSNKTTRHLNILVQDWIVPLATKNQFDLTMSSSKQNLKEVALLFFKLGLFAFGGPAAHISMMEDEVVTKRNWMSRQHFLDLVGATNLIPGPNSTEMTMHVGHERAGILGLFVAGICFIFPAVVLTTILAYFYVEYGQLPSVEPFLLGIKPAVIALILSALFKLGKKALKNTTLIVIGVLAMAVSFAGVTEVITILGTGLIGLIYFGIKNKADLTSSDKKSLLLLSAPGASAAVAGVTSMKLFWVFLKIGAVLFGSGYVLIAYLDGELVQQLGWLNEQQLLDAVAIGQFTPGPVLSTASFIGYQINGWSGALAATAGIFLPSFLFVFLLNPLVPRMRNSKLLRGFLDSVNVGAVAIMAVVCLQLGYAIVVDFKAAIIALTAIFVVFKFKKVSSIWIIVGGALLGYLLQFI